MATKETAELGNVHPPRKESIEVFEKIEQELKKALVHLRHDHDKHQPETFAIARDLSDHDLASFSADDFLQVRVGTTAYGFILFGKLRIPALLAAADDKENAQAYVHFRAFSDGPDQEARFHSFDTRETDTPTTEGDGHLHTYRTLLTLSDDLEWFD